MRDRRRSLRALSVLWKLTLAAPALAQVQPVGNSAYIPSLALDGSGGFVVTWTSGGSAGSDDSGSSVQARRFGSDGTPAGTDFQVNVYTTGNQDHSTVSLDGSGGFVVV